MLRQTKSNSKIGKKDINAEHECRCKEAMNQKLILGCDGCRPRLEVVLSYREDGEFNLFSEHPMHYQPDFVATITPCALEIGLRMEYETPEWVRTGERWVPSKVELFKIRYGEQVAIPITLELFTSFMDSLCICGYYEGLDLDIHLSGGEHAQMHNQCELAQIRTYRNALKWSNDKPQIYLIVNPRDDIKNLETGGDSFRIVWPNSCCP